MSPHESTILGNSDQDKFFKAGGNLEREQSPEENQTVSSRPVGKEDNRATEDRLARTAQEIKDAVCLNEAQAALHNTEGDPNVGGQESASQGWRAVKEQVLRRVQGLQEKSDRNEAEEAEYAALVYIKGGLPFQENLKR